MTPRMELEDKIIDLENERVVERLETFFTICKTFFSKIIDTAEYLNSSTPPDYNFNLKDFCKPFYKTFIHRFFGLWSIYTYKGYFFSFGFANDVRLVTIHELKESLNMNPNIRIVDVEKILSLDYVKECNAIYEKALQAVVEAEESLKKNQHKYLMEVSIPPKETIRKYYTVESYMKG